jgi:hypothetical protein
MGRINNLAQFLQETRPAYERRLEESSDWRAWSGTIDIEGGRLRARMTFSRGKLMVSDGSSGRRRLPRNGGPVILLRGDEESVQQIVMAVATPFEEHLQMRCQTIPTLNEQTTKLLEVLFPRHVPYLL